MEIKSLLKEAFINDEDKLATAAIERARVRVSEVGQVDARSLEVVIPKQPDDAWLRERVLRPLIYFSQSVGAAPPNCPGVFMSFFHAGRIYCVLGAEVIAWAAEQLAVDPQVLIDRYGTGESEHAAPRTPA